MSDREEQRHRNIDSERQWTHTHNPPTALQSRKEYAAHAVAVKKMHTQPPPYITTVTLCASHQRGGDGKEGERRGERDEEGGKVEAGSEKSTLDEVEVDAMVLNDKPLLVHARVGAAYTDSVGQVRCLIPCFRVSGSRGKVEKGEKRTRKTGVLGVNRGTQVRPYMISTRSPTLSIVSQRTCRKKHPSRPGCIRKWPYACPPVCQHQSSCTQYSR